jgi:hypothetical protein
MTSEIIPIGRFFQFSNLSNDPIKGGLKPKGNATIEVWSIYLAFSQLAYSRIKSLSHTT